MRRIKAAIIGSGFMGSAHLEALQRIGGIEVAAITSGSIRSSKTLAEKYGIEKICESWKDVVKDSKIEVVHNCTPNFLHYEINRAVINSGKHIISEKPLTINSRQSAELLRIVKKNKVVNAINFNYRFYPLIQHAKSEVQKGTFGDLYLAHGHYIQDWLYYKSDYNWRLESKLSGSSRTVADIGSHWCDLIQFVTGLKIKKVFADLITIYPQRQKPMKTAETFKGKETKKPSKSVDIKIDTEDAGSVLLQFENGAKGVFTVSQISAGRKNRLWFEIDGSNESIAWDQEEPNSLWIGHREKPNEKVIKDPSLLSDEAKKYAHYPGGHPEGYPEGLKNLFANVYNFIREKKNPLKDKVDFPTFEDGHWENKIIEAVLKSNKTKKWVEV